MTIEIVALADHEWALQVQDSTGRDPSYHRVRVVPETLEQLGVSDERALVHDSVESYLEHGSTKALPNDLTVDWLERNVPEFVVTLTSRHN